MDGGFGGNCNLAPHVQMLGSPIHCPADNNYYQGKRLRYPPFEQLEPCRALGGSQQVICEITLKRLKLRKQTGCNLKDPLTNKKISSSVQHCRTIIRQYQRLCHCLKMTHCCLFLVQPIYTPPMDGLC